MIYEEYEESKENIKIFLNKLLENVDLVITYAAIGGGTGTGITPLINEYIDNLDIPVISFIQRSFSFKGIKRREKVFNEYYNNFKKSTNNLFVVDCDKEINKKTNNICELFKEANMCMTNKILEYINNI